MWSLIISDQLLVERGHVQQKLLASSSSSLSENSAAVEWSNGRVQGPDPRRPREFAAATCGTTFLGLLGSVPGLCLGFAQPRLERRTLLLTLQQGRLVCQALLSSPTLLPSPHTRPALRRAFGLRLVCASTTDRTSCPFRKKSHQPHPSKGKTRPCKVFSLLCQSLVVPHKS